MEMLSGSTNPRSLGSVPNEWTIQKVEDLCVRVTSGGTPSRSNSEFYRNGRFDWYKTKELKDGFLENSEEKITSEAIRQSSAKLLPPQTVLMAMYGDGKTITSLGILRKEASCNQACCAMIPNRSVCDPGFLFYALKHHRQDFLQIATGGAQRNLSGSLIRQFAILTPPLVEQKSIADTLGALDDKIELNRKMNETLEEIARTIFTSWFVNFDPVRAKAEGRQPEGMDAETAALFPASFVDSELGRIPEGWSVVRVGEILKLEYGKALKESARIPGEIPVFGSNGQIGYHDKPLTRAPGIVVGRKGTAGTVTRVYEDFFPIDTTFYVVLDSPRLRSISFANYMLATLDLPNHGSDSAVPGLNRNTALSFNVVLPSERVLMAFDRIVNPIFDLVDVNSRQTKTLIETRDTILPKLISGEIRVHELDKVRTV